MTEGEREINREKIVVDVESFFLPRAAYNFPGEEFLKADHTQPLQGNGRTCGMCYTE